MIYAGVSFENDKFTICFMDHNQNVIGTVICNSVLYNILLSSIPNTTWLSDIEGSYAINKDIDSLKINKNGSN